MTQAVKRIRRSPAFIRGYLNSYPQALVRSQNLQDYYKLLTDYKFLSQKIAHPEFGVQAVIEDYHLLSDPEVLDSPERIW